jgi:hypothetical protein
MNKVKLVALAICMATLSGTGTTVAAEPGAQQLRQPLYHYVGLDPALPAGFDFLDIPAAINDSGSVYVTGYKCGDAGCLPTVLKYRNGTMSSVHDGIAYSANNDGTVGGSVLTDPDNSIEQAALFADDGTVVLIPRRPGESTSHVRKVTNTGIALVESVNETTGRTRFYLYLPGKRVLPLRLGKHQILDLDVNDRGIVAGTIAPVGPANDRAFRYNPLSNVRTLLNPLPTEQDSWGMAINSRGEVLGYSFISGGRERIGSWRRREFRVSFTEGTTRFPTVSNSLLWNDHNLIVITDTTDLSSYIVNSPGVRKNLANLSDNFHPWTSITDVNECGDLIGVGGTSRYVVEHSFILERRSCLS